MAIKKKEFLKKYVGTINSGDGTWSGKGMGGIPIAGAMGGGDGYKEKIGREKIPWSLKGYKGQPSMAADAGFSSIVMSRVNKGRDKKYDPKPMFPDQDMKEPDEVDNYISELNSQESLGMSNYFKEDQIVANPKYSLKDLSKTMEEQIEWRRFVPEPVEDAVDWAGENWRSAVPDFLEDEAEAAAEAVSGVLEMGRDAGAEAAEYIQDKIEDLGVDAETFEEVKDKALEIGRDFLAMTAMGIPVIGTYAAASFVLYNMAELDNAHGDLQESLDRLFVDGTESDVKELEVVTARMFDDYIDMLQASTYLIPFVGTAKGIVGSAARLLSRSKAAGAARFFGLAGNKALGAAIRSEILLSPVFRFVVEISESDLPQGLGIDQSRLYDVVVRTPAWLQASTKVLESALLQLEAWSESGSQGAFRFDPSALGLSAEESDEIYQRLSDDDYKSGLASWVTDEMENIRDNIQDTAQDAADDASTDLFQEKKEMKNKEDLLRQFIRESIYHATQTDLDAQPTGFAYRNPPSSDKDEVESMGSGENLVNFKTDVGYASYQSRPENLREEALRRIIRRKIKILESKKKK